MFAQLENSPNCRRLVLFGIIVCLVLSFHGISKKLTYDRAPAAAAAAMQQQMQRVQNKKIKIVLMTKNEWPLLRSWVLYHSHTFGIENLYIIDSSTLPVIRNFLETMRTRGLQVLCEDLNLNDIEGKFNEVMRDLAPSSDLMIKLDTDEFLMLSASHASGFR